MTMGSIFRVAVAVVFLALMTADIYPLNQEPGHFSSFENALRLGAWLGFPIVGLLIGRWWAIPLVFLPVLIAIPAGPDLADNDQPAMWFQVLFGAILFGAPATAVGVVLRKGADWFFAGRNSAVKP
jgi:hypothetical protein